MTLRTDVLWAFTFDKTRRLVQRRYGHLSLTNMTLRTDVLWAFTFDKTRRLVQRKCGHLSLTKHDA